MLPDKGAEWPPRPFDRSQKEMFAWNAWHIGDVDALAAIYEEQNRPKVSVVGAVRAFWDRYFWGRPNQQHSRRLHVPAPADVARTMGDLVFAQRPMFVVGENDAIGDRKKTQDRLQKLLGEDDSTMSLTESAELGSVLGGSYLRWWWDKDIADKVRLGSVAADAAIPTFRYDTLVAVTFWKIVHDDDGVLYRHLERHEPGRIIHGLYQGDRSRLGRKLPLTEHPSTEWAAPLVDEEGAIPTGVRGLTATYVPNGAARRWRNEPGLSQLGRSDFEGLEPVFDALDETYSAWMRDIELGKARLFVAEDMLQSGGTGGGLHWDSEQSIFTAMAPGMGSAASGGAPVQANQFAIRYLEYAHTVAELLNVILRGTGLSSSSFADNSLAVGVQSQQTATEVNSKDRLSERTRDRKINAFKAKLRPFARTGFELDAAIFGTGLGLREMPEVRFPVRAHQSPTEMSQTISTLYTSGVLSLEQAVRQQNPNWSSDDVNDELDRIKKDEERKAQLGVVEQAPDPDEENHQF